MSIDRKSNRILSDDQRESLPSASGVIVIIILAVLTVAICVLGVWGLM